MNDSSDFLDQILKYGPSPGTFYLALNKLREEGNLNLVIQQCLKALDIYPDDFRLRKLLGEAYLQAGLVGQAESEFKKLISDLPELTSSYKILAEIYMEQDRREEASNALKKYIALFPDDEKASTIFGGLIAANPAVQPNDVPESINESMINDEKRDGDITELATSTLAEIYFNQGQINEAIHTYEKVLSEDPGNTSAIERLEELRRHETSGEEGKKVEGKTKERKEKVINILEGWLIKIKEANSE